MPTLTIENLPELTDMEWMLKRPALALDPVLSAQASIVQAGRIDHPASCSPGPFYRAPVPQDPGQWAWALLAAW